MTESDVMFLKDRNLLKHMETSKCKWRVMENGKMKGKKKKDYEKKVEKKMTKDMENERRLSQFLSIKREREREREREEKERQAIPQQKTIVVLPEGNVNFCAVGQCYRRRAQNTARQKFVWFYMKIGWSSTRSHSFCPPRCRTATSLPRGIPPSPELIPDVRCRRETQSASENVSTSRETD